MAFVELTKEENPKLAVQVNNSLKYQDKDGNLKDRQEVTALIDIVKEAGQVASMGKGAVSLSLNTESGYKNYFVNKNDKEDIVLVPTDKNLQNDKDNFIYFNKKVDINNPDKHFYSMSKSGNSEQIVESIKINTTDKSAYLGARVTLSNKDLLQDMVKFEQDSGEKAVATIGKNSLTIETTSELQAKREAKSQEQNQSKEIPVEIQDKNGNVVEKTTTKKESPEKKQFKPKAKSKDKGQDIER